MKINLDHDGGVLIEMDDHEEAADLAWDLEVAAAEPGRDVVSQLINGDGVMALTVRCLPAADE